MFEKAPLQLTMKSRKPKSYRQKTSYLRKVKYDSDRQINWSKHIKELKNYKVLPVTFLSITGDAPKDFVMDREYRPGHRSKRNPYDRYIAKVGSKFYPLESITEHLMTRIGESIGLNIAGSKLRTLQGQVRFFSKYFLRRGEILTHGAEVYELCLGKKNYAQLAESKTEAEYFSFQMTCESIESCFPDHADGLKKSYVRMLVFDAIVGHNDRHPYNWGVIEPISVRGKPRFSPVFDSARGLFWNIPENKVRAYLDNPAGLSSYIDGCKPPVNWDGREGVGFSELIGLIWRDYPLFREDIEELIGQHDEQLVERILFEEFEGLFSSERRVLIQRCLAQRCSALKQEVGR